MAWVYRLFSCDDTGTVFEIEPLMDNQKGCVVDLGPPVVLECCSAVCQRARRRDGDGDCLTEN